MRAAAQLCQRAALRRPAARARAGGAARGGCRFPLGLPQGVPAAGEAICTATRPIRHRWRPRVARQLRLPAARGRADGTVHLAAAGAGRGPSSSPSRWSRPRSRSGCWACATGAATASCTSGRRCSAPSRWARSRRCSRSRSPPAGAGAARRVLGARLGRGRRRSCSCGRCSSSRQRAARRAAIVSVRGRHRAVLASWALIGFAGPAASTRRSTGALAHRGAARLQPDLARRSRSACRARPRWPSRRRRAAAARRRGTAVRRAAGRAGRAGLRRRRLAGALAGRLDALPGAARRADRGGTRPSRPRLVRPAAVLAHAGHGQQRRAWRIAFALAVVALTLWLAAASARAPRTAR